MVDSTPKTGDAAPRTQHPDSPSPLSAALDAAFPQPYIHPYG
jgi:hypothetical protein